MMVFGRKSEASEPRPSRTSATPEPPLPHVDGRFRQPTDVTWDAGTATSISATAT